MTLVLPQVTISLKDPFEAYKGPNRHDLGTGTPEPGGWTTRELIGVLRGIDTLNVVGADIVEVSPAYDGAGEMTALAAAQVAFELLTSMVKRGMSEGNSQKVHDEL